MTYAPDRRLSFVLAALVGFAIACGPPVTDPVDAGPQEDGGGETSDGGPDGGEAGGDGGVDAGPMLLANNDIAIVRLNADGTLDDTFGTQGVATVDLGVTSATANDSVYSLAVDAMGRAIAFGSKKGEGDRTDADRVVVRLTPAGVLDTTFGTGGVQTFNSAGNLTDNARHGFVQADGKILASGYTPLPTGVGTQVANSVVLARLDDTGAYDPTFGMDGVVISNPLQSTDMMTPWGMAEAYAIRQQGSKYVTAGYGRASAMGTVDVVSFRYTDSGALDTTWGTNGLFVFDVGVAQDDRGRDLVTLPDGRVVIVGNGKATATDIDPLVIVLTKNGALDTAFSQDGFQLFDFGRPDEAFFGASVAPDGKSVAAAGYVSGKVNGMDEDADAALFVMPLGGMMTPLAKTTPISETSHDRFWGVTHGSDGKIYATGFVDEGGDHRTIVARFLADGTLDASFGTAGVVRINAVAGGVEEAGRAIVVQSDGKIVVTTSVKHVE